MIRGGGIIKKKREPLEKNMKLKKKTVLFFSCFHARNVNVA